MSYFTFWEGDPSAWVVPTVFGGIFLILSLVCCFLQWNNKKVNRELGQDLKKAEGERDQVSSYLTEADTKFRTELEQRQRDIQTQREAIREMRMERDSLEDELQAKDREAERLRASTREEVQKAEETAKALEEEVETGRVKITEVEAKYHYSQNALEAAESSAGVQAMRLADIESQLAVFKTKAVESVSARETQTDEIPTEAPKPPAAAVEAGGSLSQKEEKALRLEVWRLQQRLKEKNNQVHQLRCHVQSLERAETDRERGTTAIALQPAPPCFWPPPIHSSCCCAPPMTPLVPVVFSSPQGAPSVLYAQTAASIGGREQGMEEEEEKTNAGEEEGEGECEEKQRLFEETKRQVEILGIKKSLETERLRSQVLSNMLERLRAKFLEGGGGEKKSESNPPPPSPLGGKGLGFSGGMEPLDAPV